VHQNLFLEVYLIFPLFLKLQVTVVLFSMCGQQNLFFVSCDQQKVFFVNCDEIWTKIANRALCEIYGICGWFFLGTPVSSTSKTRYNLNMLKH
jgi:hypothetical protein